MRRLAVLSLHTSPLAQPGTGDGGGMNVYVRELATALARTGCRVRRLHPGVVGRPACRWSTSSRDCGSTTCRPDPWAPWPRRSLPGGGRRVHRRRAGPDDRGRGLRRPTTRTARFEAVHANYWLSGLAGHAHQARARPPAVSHLPHPRPGEGRGRPRGGARPTAPTAGPRPRPPSCAARTPCWPRAPWRPSRSPTSTAPTRPGSAVVAPGVDHAFFGPGHRPQARRALGLPADGTLLLFVGSHPAAQGRRRGRAGPGRAGRRPAATTAWWSWAGRAVPTARSTWPS